MKKNAFLIIGRTFETAHRSPQKCLNFDYRPQPGKNDYPGLRMNIDELMLMQIL